jgi:hypothetical protein
MTIKRDTEKFVFYKYASYVLSTEIEIDTHIKKISLKFVELRGAPAFPNAFKNPIQRREIQKNYSLFHLLAQFS